MLIETLLFLIGLGTLLLGADRLVDAAVALAKDYGVSTFFIGVTVISIGTSIPEIAVTIVSAMNSAGDIVVGNIIGSETTQITLAVGIVALIAPITSKRKDVMMYGGTMVAAMVIMLFAIHSGRITVFESLFMMLTYVFFLYFMYATDGGEEIAEEAEKEVMNHRYFWLVVGLVAVPIGAHLMVESGIVIAEQLGVPQFLIGQLTGIATTLPEIAVAGLAAYQGTAGVSAGSLLGSNITDPLFSIGVAGFVADVIIQNQQAVMSAGIYMVAVSAFVVGIWSWREGIDRPTALLCILLFLPSFFI
ncbi:MAG: sodium:calcium antiporter [Candidatus Nanohaloarchaeota archaeon QJJ-5]|nr:sodium:calcium antiporter [Candidatus Nanohaloarchaeota archaeon QJJ-5]